MKESLYNHDFYAWLNHNTQALKQRRLEQVDIDNLVEELESMGRSEKRQLLSRLSILIAHLLKWEYQPSMRSRSWELTIKVQRKRLLRLLSESPSLKSFIEGGLEQAYEDGVTMAAEETGLAEEQFNTTPRSLKEYLDLEYLPN